MNRFVKDNLVLFIVMGCTVIGALVLLTFAVMGHSQMFRYHAEVKELERQIEELNTRKPVPVKGNIAPITARTEYFRSKTAELLPHFGQIKGKALDAFVKELGVDKQKFLETFRAAWEADEDRKNVGGRFNFYQRFSLGRSGEHNWAADLKLSQDACEKRWEKAMQAFCKEYQKLTVEEINSSNRQDILLSVLGVPRNFDGDPERCTNEFMVPLIQRMQEICAKPPMTAEEIAAQTAAAKKKVKSDDEADFEEDVFQDKVELPGEAGFFGFNLKIKPKESDLADITKQGEVIGDLVNRIATAKVSALNSFVIRNKYAGEKVGRYVIYHYTFSVSGDIARVRRLVKDLNDAARENRMYIVRSVFLYADKDGAAEIMQIRKEEQQRQLEEQLGTGTRSENGSPAEMGGGRSVPAPAMGMPDDPAGGMQQVRVKTAEEIRKEEMAKPYDKRTGYGRLLFGGSKNCEAVFDVEYVYLAEPELE